MFRKEWCVGRCSESRFIRARADVSVSAGPIITGVHTALVDVPLGQRTITDSQSSVQSVEFLQVSIETDAGITGYGFNWNYTRGLRSVQVMIDDCFAPAVLGMSAFDRQAAWQAMHTTTHFIGRVGVAQVGLCAMNLALWDVQLKVEGVPLWRHLGPVRDRVKAYNTDGGWLTWTTDEVIDDMRRIIDRGFDAVKMKLGRSEPKEDFSGCRLCGRQLGTTSS